MVPREAGRGTSFKGAGLYYLHDKRALTDERIGFTHTENLPTDDPEKALRWMAWTAMNADDLKRESGVLMNGRSCEKPVYTFSLAWHPEEQPEQEEMIGAGRRALIALGLEDHQAVMASHTDRPHAHLHLIVNVVHPETGRANRLSFSHLKLSEFAEALERQNGNIYCDQRVENNARRAQGESVKYREPEVDAKAVITELYQQSDSGQAFQAALQEQGFHLAQGKRVVLLDSEGKIHSLYRQIDGAKSSDIKAKLADLELPDVDEVRGRIEEASRQTDHQQVKEETPKDETADAKSMDPSQPAPTNPDREQQDRERRKPTVDASVKTDQAARTKQQAPPRPIVSPARLNALQDQHFAELGSFYTNNSHERLKLNAELDQFYGESTRQLQADIAHLDGVLADSGPVRRWWLTLTRQIPAQPEAELDNMRRSLENAKWREHEARQALESRIERERRAIEHRQKQERAQLRDEMTPPGLPESYQPLPHPEEDIGPSFEY